MSDLGLPSGYVDYFEAPGHWGRAYATSSPGERSRVDAIDTILPPDVGTILEVGCGDGLLANELASRGRDVTGADISAEALRHVRVPTMRASTVDLPVGDRSFDCVIAADVLEHLPAAVFEQSIAELQRVATRLLLINSPHNEDLVLAQTRCTRCSCVFHASRHVRSIGEGDIVGWFPAFDLTETRLAGEPWARRSRRLQRLAQVAGDVWYRPADAVCPNCGYGFEPPRPNPLIRAANGAAQRLVTKVQGSRPSELVVLLTRR